MYVNSNIFCNFTADSYGLASKCIVDVFNTTQQKTAYSEP